MLFSETTPAAQMQRLVMSHTGFPCRGLEQNLKTTIRRLSDVQHLRTVCTQMEALVMRHSGFSSAAAWNQVNPHSAVLHTLTNQAKPRCADGGVGDEPQGFSFAVAWSGLIRPQSIMSYDQSTILAIIHR